MEIEVDTFVFDDASGRLQLADDFATLPLVEASPDAVASARMGAGWTYLTTARDDDRQIVWNVWSRAK
ncbi:MAG: hypothetical protein P1U38_06575 [Aeromicrobium sp.]|uniref:hypothetical protein n=1 Tax=Aeromicrobium sp. TaxID=1871063 RepID=UPI00262AE861|nr:hypothetical protein [Aeromicrobium sp.]MDF1704422.1 hypothetical protein [Aeromicrobium sp.]